MLGISHQVPLLHTTNFFISGLSRHASTKSDPPSNAPERVDDCALLTKVATRGDGLPDGQLGADLETRLTSLNYKTIPLYD